MPGGDAGPTRIDWDSEERFDLTVGAGDGSAWLFRNTGAKGARIPRLPADARRG